MSTQRTYESLEAAEKHIAKLTHRLATCAKHEVHMVHIALLFAIEKLEKMRGEA